MLTDPDQPGPSSRSRPACRVHALIRRRRNLLVALCLGVALVAAGAATVAVGTGSPGARTFQRLDLTSRAAPSRRLEVAMAYYPPDHDVVLFGGVRPDLRPVAGTWIFTAHGWHQEHPVHSPPARSAADLVYDPANRLLILYSGQSGGRVLADTWAWNGHDWTRLRPARIPTWMPGAPTALDTHTGLITELAPRPGYPGSFAPVAAFNGGPGPVGMWTYVGTTWAYRSLPRGPGLIAGSMVDDPLTGRLLYFTYDFPVPSGPCTPATVAKGCDRVPPDPTGTRYSQTWAQTAHGFVEQHPTRAPTSSQLMVADGRTGRAVVIDATGRVWSWTGRTWTVTDPHPGPSNAGTAVYDAALGDVVVFATDTNGAHPTNRTWLWNGRSWTVAP